MNLLGYQDFTQVIKGMCGMTFLYLLSIGCFHTLSRHSGCFKLSKATGEQDVGMQTYDFSIGEAE